MPRDGSNRTRGRTSGIQAVILAFLLLSYATTAVQTGLEPAVTAMTGQRPNQAVLPDY